MKKLLSVILSIAILSVLLFSYALALSPQEAELISTPHEFKVIPGSEEWSTYYEPAQKLAACYVSPDELQKMTTDALVKTVLTYPLLIDMYAYNTIDIGINAVSTNFAGIEELSTRSDAIKFLEAYCKQLPTRDKDTDISYFYADTLLEYINNKGVKSDAPSLKYWQCNVLDSKFTLLRYSTVNVYTPKGSAVSAYSSLTWSDHGVSQAAATAVSDQFLITYPSSTKVSGVNPAYNCHSYAWYSASTSNSYWIDNPAKYMSDDSYTSGTAKIGSKVYYSPSAGVTYAHSGIISATSSGGTPATVKSKWGYNYLFTHYTNDCPYVNYAGVVVSAWN